MVLPNKPCSWIGKAHLVGATVECSYSAPAPGEQEWVLTSGTPASCTQLGLYHLFQDLPPVDLVVSGPNFGRNATTIYNLSSGTVGGALEAALCKKKAIALSFASKDVESSTTIGAAARISVKLIEKLYHNWGSGVELYNINVPMTAAIENHQILYTDALRSRWSSGSFYQELLTNGFHGEVTTNGHTEVVSNGHNDLMMNGCRHEDSPKPQKPDERRDDLKGLAISRTRLFKWAPQLSDITRCVNESPPGTDAWAVQKGFIRYVNLALNNKKNILKIHPISVTPLTASFAQVDGISGTLKLS